MAEERREYTFIGGNIGIRNLCVFWALIHMGDPGGFVIGSFPSGENSLISLFAGGTLHLRDFLVRR